MGALPRIGIATAAIVAALFSALAIVASTHDSRALYARLQELEGRRWYLEEEYSRLLIEQSTWASHYRIERQAGDMLQMAVPAHERVRLVPR